MLKKENTALIDKRLQDKIISKNRDFMKGYRDDDPYMEQTRVFNHICLCSDSRRGLRRALCAKGKIKKVLTLTQCEGL